MDCTRTASHEEAQSLVEAGVPVVLVDACESWYAYGAWRHPDGRLDASAVSAAFTNPTVPVESCGDAAASYDCAERTEMPLDAYLAALAEDRAGLGYLKDWHAARRKSGH